MIFENGQVKFSSPFYLYDPGSRLFSLGGVMPVDEIVEILVRRIDGFLACMRSDGRVVFIAENVVELMIGKDNQPEISQESYTGPFRYRRLLVKGALIHMVEADLKYHSFSTSVSPYYDKINPGSARTLFVDDLARRAGAKAAINGTFFNMDPGSELYGWPVGSFFASGKLLHSLDSPSLNALNRSYLAFTNGGRLIVGETNQKGTEILRLNQAGSFDSAKFGSERIAAFGGGFGWLVKNGDPQAWKAYAGKQFDPSFYSRTSRRARSLVGVDAGGRHIFMLAQEEGSSSPTPMSHPELAEYIAATT
ncbi:MAG: phosphodiester glycosidase family protein, partial [Candidatus Rifleibacteriota bacterium]